MIVCDDTPIRQDSRAVIDNISNMIYYQFMKIYDIDNRIHDYRHLDWTESAVTSGTSGSLLKAREDRNKTRYYYKLSSYDPYRGIYCSECVNEIVACRLMNILGIEHLQYKLIRALVSIGGKEHETWMCRSENYRMFGERKIALDNFYEMNRKEGEYPFDLCIRFGWKNTIYKMILVDYLIINRDRHGANIEVLRDVQGNMRLAPLFDNGLSFLAPLAGRDDRIKSFDPMDDVPANNFIGTRSLEHNLQLMEDIPLVDPITLDSKETLLEGLDDILPDYHLEKMWQIIWNRWKHYEDFCNKK